MPIPHWYDPDSGWDQLYLGTVAMPGVWKVECSVSYAVDVKKGKGLAGATMTDEGYEPAKVTMMGRFLPSHLGDWAEAVRALSPRQRSKQRPPLKVRHPNAQIHGVENVYLLGIGSVEIDRGIGSVKVDAIEWFPAPKKVKKAIKPKKVTPTSFEEQGAKTGFINLLGAPTSDDPELQKLLNDPPPPDPTAGFDRDFRDFTAGGAPPPWGS